MNDLPPTTRRTALRLGGAALACAVLPVAAQGDYPAKPIRIIVPFPAGGVADAVVRSMADRLQVTMKQTFIVDNKPGGLFTIGLQALLSAPSDGYTLLHINAGMAAIQAATKRYDLLRQLAPITEANYGPTVLFVSMKAPFTNIPEMIAYGKANPGKINYGTLGPGSIEHLVGHSVAKSAGFEATPVPYKGMPDAVVSMLQGDIHVLSTVYQVGKQFVDKGQMRLLGVFDEQRLANLPDVPTIKQQGLDAPLTSYWAGFAVQPDVPPPIIETLRREIAAAVMFPAVRERTETAGSIASYSASSADFRQKIARDLAWMGQAVKSAGLNLS